MSEPIVQALAEPTNSNPFDPRVDYGKWFRFEADLRQAKAKAEAKAAGSNHGVLHKTLKLPGVVGQTESYVTPVVPVAPSYVTPASPVVPAKRRSRKKACTLDIVESAGPDDVEPDWDELEWEQDQGGLDWIDRAARKMQVRKDSIYTKQPTSAKGVQKSLFALARVYADDNDPDSPETKAAVREWHDLAVKNGIPMLSFETIWDDFQAGVRKVRHPHGSILRSLAEKAMEDDSELVPGHPGDDNIARFFRAVNRYWRDEKEKEVFPLDYNSAGDALDMYAEQVRRAAKRLVKRGLLEIVESPPPGVRGRCTEWRWLGPP
jgi:hypothetical protein